MNLIQIGDATPVHGFPEIYNGNLNEIAEEIANLKSQLAKKDKKIEELKDKFNNALNVLRAEYLEKLREHQASIEEFTDQWNTTLVNLKSEIMDKFDELDDKYVKKPEDNQ